MNTKMVEVLLANGALVVISFYNRRNRKLSKRSLNSSNPLIRLCDDITTKDNSNGYFYAFMFHLKAVEKVKIKKK